MEVYKIDLPTGALRLYTVGERSSLFEVGERALCLAPDDTHDLELKVGESVALTDALAAVSGFLACYRGIPGESLDVCLGKAVYSLPKFDTPPSEIAIPLGKCKQLLSSDLVIGGVPERVFTARSERTYRLILAGSGYPMDLLRRLLVIDGLPLADVAISYSYASGEVSLCSTQDSFTAEALPPLSAALYRDGVLGEISVKSTKPGLKIKILGSGDSLALYSTSDIRVSRLSSP